MFHLHIHTLSRWYEMHAAQCRPSSTRALRLSTGHVLRICIQVTLSLLIEIVRVSHPCQCNMMYAHEHFSIVHPLISSGDHFPQQLAKCRSLFALRGLHKYCFCHWHFTAAHHLVRQPPIELWFRIQFKSTIYVLSTCTSFLSIICDRRIPLHISIWFMRCWHFSLTNSPSLISIPHIILF